MKALDISKYVLAFFDEFGDHTTNKKLQKLIYYIEAWGLVYTGSIIDEDFEAWVHGPVIPEVYQNYKGYGYSQIILGYADGDSSSKRLKVIKKDLALPNKTESLINAVLTKYGALSSLQLELLSHSEKPWQEARKGLSPVDHSSAVIDKNLMKEYYSSLVNGEKKES